ncbi:Protein N-acetyltransferase, RimJ/RimL family [Reichenbachiella faecimaris]|uniref:Protein N-acetyltransferase, RimJ/RimL family n=1 Tax=Reichenbachiella faecimaris TaxID=692418 RepID=A0A1W2GQV9_REIFA|nr:GNAT family N-acetyltransferase [Reichenbachiella faecimaris]SMD38944.1 Protein N-acetyltransferase, RimJ/RimL family [Reichenbachiella faecimaris]
MIHNSIITTERTYLSTPDTLEFHQIRKLDSDPEIMRYITKGKPRSAQESEEWITKRRVEYKKNGFGLMPVYLKESDEFIGWAGLKFLDETSKIEVGYRFDKPYWGMGLATEITKAVVSYAREKLGIQQLVAVTDLENEASKKVLLKSGFKFLNQAFYYNTDVDYFELNF